MLHGQDLMVTDEERGTMKKNCWHMPHMPPRLRCALGATEV